MSHSRGGLSLGVPPSSLAWGSFDQSLQRQRVHIGGLVLGRSYGLLSGMCGFGGGWGETLTLSESIRYLPSTVDSVGHSR